MHQGRRRQSRRRKKRHLLTRRAILIGSSLAGLAVAARFLSRSGNSGERFQRVPTPQSAILQLSGPISVQHAGDVIASSNESGLHIELRDGASDVETVEAVVGGRSSFGVMSAIRFMVARAQGAPIVAFGAELLDTPIAFFSLATSNVNSPTDFRGLRIPRQQGTDAAIVYDAVLANLGISRGEIKERDTPATISMLIDRTVDVLPGELAATSYELRKAKVPYTVLRPGDYGIHVPGSIYFTNEGALRDHPSVVSRFLRRVIAGWHQVYTDEIAAAQIVGSAAKISLARAEFELKAQRNLVLPVERRLAEFDDLQWKQLRIMLLQERLVREETDFSAAVDYSVLRDVYRPPLSFGQ